MLGAVIDRFTDYFKISINIKMNQIYIPIADSHPLYAEILMIVGQRL